MSIEFRMENLWGEKEEYDVKLNALDVEEKMMKRKHTWGGDSLRKLSNHDDIIGRIRDMLYYLNPQERNNILSELYHWNFYENERQKESSLSYEFIKTRLLNQKKDMLSSIEYADKIMGNKAEDFLTEKDVKIE